MKAKSINGNSTEEIKAALALSITDGFKPTLAFVFMSVKQDIEAVSNLLDQHGIQIFGATSSGEFIDGDISNGGIAVLMMDINPANFEILLHDYRDKEPEAVAKEMASKAKEKFKNPSIILSTSFYARGELESLLGDQLIRTIESVAGKDTTVWGGRAGDDFIFDESVVFTNHLITKRGIIMLVFDGDKIIATGEAASGQKPVGTEKVITKAVGNWVYEIDNKPAAEMVLKYLGLNLSSEEAETFNPSGMGIAFSVSRDKGEAIIRGVGMFNWKDKSVSVLGSIHQGDRVRFTLPPDFEVIEEVKLNAEKIQHDEMPEADALLMFSCIGRLTQFGPLAGDEIEGVRKAFNVPMAGFFTYGEYGRARNGNNEFHNNTCCWVALKEK
jgi:hypothetical protein